jgi:hypothetical protein
VYKDGIYEHREALAEALGHARRIFVTTKGNWKRDEEFIGKVVRQDLPNLKVLSLNLQRSCSDSFEMLQGFFIDFINLHPNRIEVFDLDNFEEIEKDSTIELDSVLKLLYSQSASLRELRLGIDSHYNERFTVPLLRELKRMSSLKKLRIKFDSIALEQIF